MTIARQVSRIETNAKAIAADDHRLAQIAEEQRQRRARMIAAKEQLLIDVSRDVGLLDLPAPAIARIVTSLKDICVREGVTASTETEIMTAQKQPKAKVARPVTRGRRSTGGAVDGTVAVVVKASRNVAAVKLEALESARLTWSGKAGTWHGQVDAETVKRLRAVFGDRVTIEGGGHSTKTARPVPATDETGGEGGIEAVASVAPVVIEDVPAGDGTGAEKPLEAPTEVQGGHGEPPAVAKTPAPMPAFGRPRAAASARPLPSPPGAAQ